MGDRKLRVRPSELASGATMFLVTRKIPEEEPCDETARKFNHLRTTRLRSDYESAFNDWEEVDDATTWEEAIADGLT